MGAQADSGSSRSSKTGKLVDIAPYRFAMFPLSIVLLLSAIGQSGASAPCCVNCRDTKRNFWPGAQSHAVCNDNCKSWCAKHGGVVSCEMVSKQSECYKVEAMNLGEFGNTSQLEARSANISHQDPKSWNIDLV